MTLWETGLLVASWIMAFGLGGLAVMWLMFLLEDDPQKEEKHEIDQLAHQDRRGSSQSHLRPIPKNSSSYEA